MNQLMYRLAAEADPAGVAQTLSQTFALKVETTEKAHLTYYDSFDWRLYQKSWALAGYKQSLYLCHLGEAKEMPPVRVEKPPVFAWELPAGSFREQLTTVLDVRALLLQARIDTESTRLHMVDDEKRTVLQLNLEAVRPSAYTDAPPTTIYVRLIPVQGHAAVAQRVAQWLGARGSTAVTPTDRFHQMMAAAGKQPGSYTAKPRLALDPTMRADMALKALLRADLEIIRLNAPYISQDIDTEFLHDFRVALRRTRSAISQFKHILPADVVIRFKSELKMVAQWTNALRDLDVYLLAAPKYRALLPDIMQADIDPLFSYLRQKRVTALAAAAVHLQSADYHRVIHDWQAFLDMPAGETSPGAVLPILPLAQRRIHKRYRLILKEGRRIWQEGDEAQMHALRIECKKLRYLLEFFASLFPPEETAVLITQLKTLQSNLGDINDLRVQEAYLSSIAGELPAAEFRQTLLAIGALVAHLHGQRAQAREKFSEAFAQFAVKGNRQLFKRLFKETP